ncbi:MAG: 3-dehydroquinate synthase [Bacteroidota bacterium]
MSIIQSINYNIHIGDESFGEMELFFNRNKYSKIIFLVDENTKKYCLPIIYKSVPALNKTSVISIKSGEKHKNIITCAAIWKALSDNKADRKSLLINLGGGVISDIGGFAASVFKRGIDFINIPTTLLAMVDASVGGKTGINFNGIKNEIGFFSFPKIVFIHPIFLKTLNKRHLVSGFAEVIKHGLIADKNYWNKVKETNALHTEWQEIITRSVEIKNKIVLSDPYESGLRKILNFGHTIGHALETYSLLHSKNPLLHGEALAIGIICETYLSKKMLGLTDEELQDIVLSIISIFRPNKIMFPSGHLIRFMVHDKKNQEEKINFTLLNHIGDAKINCTCNKKLIAEAIAFFNDAV